MAQRTAHSFGTAAAIAAAVVLALALAGCDAARPIDGGGAAAVDPDLAACNVCHTGPGQPAGTAFRDARGDTAPSSATVGAHTAHLSGAGGFHAPLACEACHVVPSPAGASSHIDGGAGEVTLGVLANAGGFTASFSPASLTCATYCHGATLPGGANTQPVWNADVTLGCGSCHGAPPPAPHPAGAACSTCHPDTVRADLTIDLARGKHMDGTVQVGAGTGGGGGCTGCHGDPQRTGDAVRQAAPPRGAGGETATTAIAVGAHERHLSAGPLSRAIACAECHAVPGDTAHVDGTARLTFGALARTGGAAPAFDRATAGCAATYCHGATLNAGGTLTTPVWTRVDGSQMACGTCHGAPPPAPHAQSADCGACHTGYTATTVNVATHVDGTVQVQAQHPTGWSARTAHGYAANADLASCKGCHGADLAGGSTGVSCDSCHGGTAWRTRCTFCHGDANRAANPAAPPVGTQGETAATTPAVGAHAAHLQAGALAPAFACTECHAVPANLDHVDGTARLAFGTLARTGGLAPSYAGGSCAATYCHGGGLAGGSDTTPTWTAGVSQAACGSCHGLPPPSPHPSVTGSCGGCHTGYTASSVNTALHVNGRVDVSASSCTACHGDAARASNPAAPPTGTRGETATTTRAVGAHQKHLQGGNLSNAVACTECHVVPTSFSHSNGVVNLAFGTLARTGGLSPSFNGTTLGCAATYCHGGSLRGGSTTTPIWTSGASQTSSCTSCHGAAPSTGHHGDHSGRACSDCHGTGYSRTNATVAKATHVDGVVQTGNRITSYNRTSRSCTNSCHGSETW